MSLNSTAEIRAPQGRARIAVIGGGVAGLGAAWALRDTAEVTLYEKSARPGGHAYTVDAVVSGQPVAVDVGFICYNEPNYPNFKSLLAHLGVETYATDMSFAVSDPNGFEWSSDLFGLFAWKRNLLSPTFQGLLQEILRFNNVARRQLASACVPQTSLGDWLDQNRFSQTFRSAYLMPMAAAIWSTPERLAPDYPVASFLNFFDNHRLMHLRRPTWRTVKGGSRAYVQQLVSDLAHRLQPRSDIRSVGRRDDGAVELRFASGQSEVFDQVVLAAHADQSLALLDSRFSRQQAALGKIGATSNRAILHTDVRLMPKRRSAWASWNVLKGPGDAVCVTYWMNRLQALPTAEPVLVTLNPVVEPRTDRVLADFMFEHPMYDAAAAAGRLELQDLQGRDGLWFAGAWLGDGFHEAGLRTGLDAARALGGRVPWRSSNETTHALPAHRSGQHGPTAKQPAEAISP